MEKIKLKKARVVDTFAARNIQILETRSTKKDIGRYSVEHEYGLELRKRRHDQNIHIGN